MARRRLLELIKPEIVETIIKNEEGQWLKADGTVATMNPLIHFEITDERDPDIIHYLCKYGYRITENDGKINVLRIGFIEYEQEKRTNNMA